MMYLDTSNRIKTILVGIIDDEFPDNTSRPVVDAEDLVCGDGAMDDSLMQMFPVDRGPCEYAHSVQSSHIPNLSMSGSTVVS